MSAFKPQLTVITSETLRESRSGWKNKSPYKTIRYSTYRELKKNIKNHLEENEESIIPVSRSRRGEWGEWFENWQLIDGVPTIIKQGWM
jgi:hypothetical protein